MRFLESRDWKNTALHVHDAMSHRPSPPPNVSSGRAVRPTVSTEHSSFISYRHGHRRNGSVASVELAHEDHIPRVEADLHEEIAEIKRYEVRGPVKIDRVYTANDMLGLYYNRFAHGIQPPPVRKLMVQCIDWVEDAAREQLRRRARRQEKAGFEGHIGWRRRLWEAYDSGQAWIVVTLIGV